MNKSLIPVLQDTQISILQAKTPKEFIKTRPGRGGKNLSYVEVGYIIKVLNDAFSPLGWDWKIIEQQVAQTQVWVKGELIIKLSPEYSVTKSAYGGSAIKKDTNGNVVDIGDDLKAASSDALKKAASLLGIAADIYFPQLDMDFSEGEVVDQNVTQPLSQNVNCESCGSYIPSEKIRNYSKSVYSKTLCLNCQKTRKSADTTHTGAPI